MPLLNLKDFNIRYVHLIKNKDNDTEVRISYNSPDYRKKINMYFSNPIIDTSDTIKKIFVDIKIVVKLNNKVISSKSIAQEVISSLDNVKTYIKILYSSNKPVAYLKIKKNENRDLPWKGKTFIEYFGNTPWSNSKFNAGPLPDKLNNDRIVLGEIAKLISETDGYLAIDDKIV